MPTAFAWWARRGRLKWLTMDDENEVTLSSEPNWFKRAYKLRAGEPGPGKPALDRATVANGNEVACIARHGFHPVKTSQESVKKPKFRENRPTAQVFLECVAIN
jgi:hypothetical protein